MIFINKQLKFYIMKKYTIIYSDSFQMGSHRNSITKMAYIECEKEKLAETIEVEVADIGSVWFILEGHCTQSED